MPSHVAAFGGGGSRSRQAIPSSGILGIGVRWLRFAGAEPKRRPESRLPPLLMSPTRATLAIHSRVIGDSTNQRARRKGPWTIARF
jgi:hypothetical protein